MARFIMTVALAVLLCSPAEACSGRFQRRGTQRPVVRALSLAGRAIFRPIQTIRSRVQTRRSVNYCQRQSPQVCPPVQPDVLQPGLPDLPLDPGEPFLDLPPAEEPFDKGKTPEEFLDTPDDLGPQPDEKSPFVPVAAVIEPDGSFVSDGVEVFVTPFMGDHDFTEVPMTEVESKAVSRLHQVIEATCRVTVNGVCGSGTVVGRSDNDNALVLTNAHVAGTRRGRTVNVQRWNIDGTSERGSGKIIAAGYGRGISLDFALLECNAEFAKDVTPIPLADRDPVQDFGVVTSGCPRCEWPSLQSLRINSVSSQLLKWSPAAIGGRSGSSVVDLTPDGPRVVGLLTWSDGKQGIGQTTPFLINAMRGRLPSSFEKIPSDYEELGGLELFSTCDSVTRTVNNQGPEEGSIMTLCDDQLCWTIPASSGEDVEWFALRDIVDTDKLEQGSFVDNIIEDRPPVIEDKPDVKPEDPAAPEGEDTQPIEPLSVFTQTLLGVLVGGLVFACMLLIFNKAKS